MHDKSVDQRETGRTCYSMLGVNNRLPVTDGTFLRKYALRNGWEESEMLRPQI